MPAICFYPYAKSICFFLNGFQACTFKLHFHIRDLKSHGVGYGLILILIFTYAYTLNPHLNRGTYNLSSGSTFGCRRWILDPIAWIQTLGSVFGSECSFLLVWSDGFGYKLLALYNIYWVQPLPAFLYFLIIWMLNFFLRLRFYSNRFRFQHDACDQIVGSCPSACIMPAHLFICDTMNKDWTRFRSLMVGFAFKFYLCSFSYDVNAQKSPSLFVGSAFNFYPSYFSLSCDFQMI